MKKLSLLCSLFVLLACSSAKNTKTETVPPINKVSGGETNKNEKNADPLPQGQENLAFIAADKAINEEKYDEAEKILKHYLLEHPRDAKAHLRLLTVRISNNRPGIARLTLENARKNNVPEDEILYYDALIALKENNYAKAVSDLTSLSEKTDSRMAQKSSQILALLYFSALDYDKALIQIEKLRNDDLLSLRLRGDAQLILKNYREAVDYYEKSAAKFPVKNQAYIELKELIAKLCEVNLDDKDKACNVYKELLALRPENVDYRSMSAFLCEKS